MPLCIVGLDTVVIRFFCHGQAGSYTVPHFICEGLRASESAFTYPIIVNFDEDESTLSSDAPSDIAGLIWEKRDA